jgi:hypothetical protein
MGNHFNEFELEKYKEDIKWVVDSFKDGHITEAEKLTLIAVKKAKIRNEFGLDLPP